MRLALSKLSEKDLAQIRGGGNFAPSKGFWAGGTYTTDSGNTFTATPLYLSVGLNNQAANKLTTTLSALGSLALTQPGLAGSSAALGSLLSYYNQGNGITFTQPTFLPIPFGLQMKPR